MNNKLVERVKFLLYFTFAIGISPYIPKVRNVSAAQASVLCQGGRMESGSLKLSARIRRYEGKSSRNIKKNLVGSDLHFET